jgi:hypothetical protein
MAATGDDLESKPTDGGLDYLTGALGPAGPDRDRDSSRGPSSGVLGGGSLGRVGRRASLYGHQRNLRFASIGFVHTSLSFLNPGVSCRP